LSEKEKNKSLYKHLLKPQNALYDQRRVILHKAQKQSM